MQGELLTADDVAARLGVQPSTVKRWAREGRVPVVRFSPKLVRYDWRAIVRSVQGSEPWVELGCSDRDTFEAARFLTEDEE